MGVAESISRLSFSDESILSDLPLKAFLQEGHGSNGTNILSFELSRNSCRLEESELD